MDIWILHLVMVIEVRGPYKEVLRLEDGGSMYLLVIGFKIELVWEKELQNEI